MESQAVEGHILVHELGQLLGEEVTLLHVEIKERPLEFLASKSAPTGKPKIINTDTFDNLRHDHVVITACDKDGKRVDFVVEKLDKTQRKLHGKTHKRLRSDPRAVTHVNIKVGYVPVPPQVSRFEANLRSVQVPITNFIAILVADGNTYDYFTHNCWHYASGITRELISLCQYCTTSDIIKENLEVYKARLDEVEREVQCVVA